MKYIISILLMMVLPPLGTVGVFAQNPLILQQKEEYAAAKELWEEHQIPGGLSNQKAFPQKQASLRTSGITRVAMQLNDVDFRFTGNIGFLVKRAVVTLEPKNLSEPVEIDYVDSYNIRLHNGEVLLTFANLTALFNQHVLDYKSRPLKNIKMKARGKNRIEVISDLRLEGFGDLEVPARLIGNITLTKNNQIVFKIEDVYAYGFPIEGLMRFLGLAPDRLVTLKRVGVVLQDFNLLMDHRTMFPFPRIKGNISSVQLTQNGLVLSFADVPSIQFNTPPSLGKSYIWIQSGDPKLFGTVVTNARMAILPKTGLKRLKFDLYNYRKQFSNGIGRINEAGMISLMIGDKY